MKGPRPNAKWWHVTASDDVTFVAGDKCPWANNFVYSDTITSNGIRLWRFCTPETLAAVRARNAALQNRKPKEQRRLEARKWQTANRAKCVATVKAWRQRNKESVACYAREYRQKNKELLRIHSAARSNKQRVNHAVDNKRVKVFYEARARVSQCLGVAIHVDHIIPLSRGGKHSPANLQLLPKSLNLVKRNSMPGDAAFTLWGHEGANLLLKN